MMRTAKQVGESLRSQEEALLNDQWTQAKDSWLSGVYFKDSRVTLVFVTADGNIHTVTGDRADHNWWVS